MMKTEGQKNKSTYVPFKQMHKYLVEYFKRDLYHNDGTLKRAGFDEETANEMATATVREKIIGGQRFGQGDSVFTVTGTYRPDAGCSMNARAYRDWKRLMARKPMARKPIDYPTPELRDRKTILIDMINYKVNDLHKDYLIKEISKFLNTSYATLYNRRKGRTRSLEKYEQTNRDLSKVIDGLGKFRVT